jgi:hypothetical protein
MRRAAVPRTISDARRFIEVSQSLLNILVLPNMADASFYPIFSIICCG